MQNQVERSGPGRRESDQRCALCETIWAYHDDERDKHRQECKEKVVDVNNEIARIINSISGKVDYRIWALSTIIFLGLTGWVIVDHFSLSKQVSYDSAIIVQMDKKVDAIIKLQEEIVKNIK
jgi:hypothetical protein